MSQEIERRINIKVTGEEKIKEHIRDIEEMIRKNEINVTQLASGRREIFAQDRAIRALMTAYRAQYTELDVTSMAFSKLGGVVNRLQGMYTMFNVAQIRQNQIQREIIDSQKDYNEAVARFGPGSEQARAAMERMTNAQKELGQIQIQNTFQMIGFALQLPSMMRGLLDTANAFKVLRVVMSQHVATTTTATATEMALTRQVVTGGAVRIASYTREAAAVTALGRARMFANIAGMLGGPLGIIGLVGGIAAAAMIPMLMQQMEPKAQGTPNMTQGGAGGMGSIGRTGSVYDTKNLNIYGDINVQSPMEIPEFMDKLSEGQRVRGAQSGMVQNQRRG